MIFRTTALGYILYNPQDKVQILGQILFIFSSKFIINHKERSRTELFIVSKL